MGSRPKNLQFDVEGKLQRTGAPPSGTGKPVLPMCDADSVAPLAEECLNATQHLNNIGYLVWDASTKGLHLSERWRILFGFSPLAMLQLADLQAVLEARDEQALRVVWLEAVQQRRQHLDAEFCARAAQGVTRYFKAHAVLRYDTKGNVQRCLVAIEDVSLPTTVLQALRRSEARLEEAQRIAHFAFWEWDFETQQAIFSAEALRMLHRPSDWKPELKDLIELVPTDQRDWVRSLYQEAYAAGKPTLRYEVRHPQPDGSLQEIHTLTKIEYAADASPKRLMATIQDITEVKSYRRQLHTLSFYDAVTLLPNRALLIERVTKALSEAAWRGQQVGLIMLDLDRFQDINDSMGHGMGDDLLRQVAQRLQHVLREYDTVARLGGDEFAVVLPGIRHEKDMTGIAEKILGAFKAAFTLAGQPVFVTASLGGALFPEHAHDVEQLMQYADAALYHAKGQGRDNFKFYRAELTVQASERLNLENELRRAVENAELELYYQPKYALDSGQLLGAEALMRWNHPQRGLVSPLNFINIAEDTGLIVPMGLWALQEACRSAVRWNAARSNALKIAVNLSARQFSGLNFAQIVRQTLEATRCRPEWLELEITESLLLDGRLEAQKMLEDIAAIGVSIAIDDFGTGYSALSYLTRFPVQVLKIDRSFIKDLPQDANSMALVKAIISLGHSLNMSLVAEGVETREQADYLISLGCQMVQGYLFGRPQNAVTFAHLITCDSPNAQY